MNTFLFQNRFEADILAGRKPHTIRGHRRDGKPRAKVGETISLRVWTGKPYRSKEREFARAVVTEVHDIRIAVDRRKPLLIATWSIQLDGRELNSKDAVELANADGFTNPISKLNGLFEMIDWFEAAHGLPFEGVLVKWRLV